MMRLRSIPISLKLITLSFPDRIWRLVSRHWWISISEKRLSIGLTRRQCIRTCAVVDAACTSLADTEPLQTPKDAASANATNIVYEPAQAKDWPPNLDLKDYTPARAVDRVANAGAICLKVFVEPGFGDAAHWPVPQPATLAALRSEASRRGLVLVVHANALESWRAALDAHADVIAHGLWHWPGKRLDPTRLVKRVRRSKRRRMHTSACNQLCKPFMAICRSSIDRCSMIRD